MKTSRSIKTSATALALLLTTLTLAGCSDNKGPGNRERSAASTASGGSIQGVCLARKSSVEDVAAVDHQAEGKFSGFIVLCADNSIHAADKNGSRGGRDERRDAHSIAAAVKKICNEQGVDRVEAINNEATGRTSGFMLRCRSNGQWKASGR